MSQLAHIAPLPLIVPELWELITLRAYPPFSTVEHVKSNKDIKNFVKRMGWTAEEVAFRQQTQAVLESKFTQLLLFFSSTELHFTYKFTERYQGMSGPDIGVSLHELVLFLSSSGCCPSVTLGENRPRPSLHMKFVHFMSL